MFSLTPAKNNNNNNIGIRPELFREKKPMKIRCDVCDKVEASVFCSADEAALCDGCDRRVHHANKLASKHLRFALLHPSSKQSSPLCDICQKRRAFLFCQEDRAILCRECDLPIHESNEHTKKHNRFLLTGVKLSTLSSLYPSSSSSTSCSNTNMIIKSTQQPYLHNNNNPSFSNENFSSPSVERSSPSMAYNNNNNNNNNVDDDISISTSSISEYLETLPGWQVDDFLDPSIATTDSFYKTNFENVSVSNSMAMDQDFESQMSPFSPEDYLGFWVPDQQQQQQQVGPVYNLLPQICSSSSSSSFDGLKESKETNDNSRKVNRKWRIEDAFTVPEMSHRTLKKSRHFL